jgi:hypothetical protein
MSGRVDDDVRHREELVNTGKIGAYLNIEAVSVMSFAQKCPIALPT